MTDAIKGLRIIRVSKGARLVPLKEMVSAIYVNTQAKSQLGTPFGLQLNLSCQWMHVDDGFFYAVNLHTLPSHALIATSIDSY